MKKIDFKEKYNVLKRTMNDMGKDHIGEFAAECSYYTILSFIPFLILLITLIQYTSIDKDTLFYGVSKIIPASMDDMVISIVEEVYSKSIGTISISIIFTLWSAGKGLYALTKGLHHIYNTNNEEVSSYIYLRVKAILETILFILLLTLGLVLLFFGHSLKSVIQNYFDGLKNFNAFWSIITQIGFIFLTFIIFLMLYKFMPRKKNTFKSQIYGAAFGAIVFNIISFVFSKYLDVFKGFYITYGSLTTLMLVMMWTYSCFYTLFLGAELNKQINKY